MKKNNENNLQGRRHTKTHCNDEATRKQRATTKHEHGMQRRKHTKANCHKEYTRKQIAMKKKY